MQWDLGLQGLGTLLVLAVVFGAVAQLIFWHRATWRVGLIATVAFFVAGIFISEVMFGWATEEDLQPNIDGLSLDEVGLIGYFIGVPLVLVLRFVTRGRMGRQIAP